ncbi:MAG: hypothetical protein H0X52_08475 [Gemmatimonadetes bacterium]|nr:hypothetical protein [Gemmatimonadota bacterium]
MAATQNEVVVGATSAGSQPYPQGDANTRARVNAAFFGESAGSGTLNH